MKKQDPLYFINGLLRDAELETKSVVITDIRTPEELSAVQKVRAKIYFVCKSISCLDNEYLEESKIKSKYIKSKIIPKFGEITTIINSKDSSYKFIHKLEKFFFREDIMDLVGPSSDSDYDKQAHKIWSKNMSDYIDQFDIRELG